MPNVGRHGGLLFQYVHSPVREDPIDIPRKATSASRRALVSNILRTRVSQQSVDLSISNCILTPCWLIGCKNCPPMTITIKRSVTLHLLVAQVLLCSELVASNNVKAVDIPYVTQTPAIDGVLNDGAWQNAAIIRDFHEVEPNEYEPPSRRSEVLVAYSDDAIYVAAILYEDDKSAKNAFVQKQAGDIQDDRFGLLLDPFNKGTSGYIFELNSLSVRDDAVFQNTNQENWNWDGIWQGKAGVREDGWVAELRIPFKTLSFDAANTTWGINFSRHVTRERKHIGWMSRNRNQDPSYFGEARGIRNVSQGIGLDVAAGASFNSRDDRLNGRHANDFEPSLDVFYRFSPSVSGALTINTDFSGTDVDEVQVNLTRFGLFFPEKRDFFLRDTDIFEFGKIGGRRFGNGSTIGRGASANGSPFFSRRIGLSRSGAEVGIDYGGKLSGRIGRWDVGLLAVQQEGFGQVNSDQLFVVRGAARVLEESQLGFILTEGNPTENLTNQLRGIDFRYLNTRLTNGRVIEGSAWYQETETEGITGDDAAYGISVAMPNSEHWQFALGFKELQENYNPALGFANRVGVRDYVVQAGYTHRPTNNSSLRALFFGVDAQQFKRPSGGTQSERATFRIMELETDGGLEFKTHVTRGRENLTRSFVLFDDAEIAAGDYDANSYRLALETSHQRSLSGKFSFAHGDFFGGDISSWSASGVWRPSPRHEFEVESELNDIELPQGRFITRTFRLSADVAFNSEWSWENFLQYDNVSDTAGWNSVVRWNPEAGREMLIVVNHGAQDFDEDGRFQTAVSDFTIKINHTFRF